MSQIHLCARQAGGHYWTCKGISSMQPTYFSAKDDSNMDWRTIQNFKSVENNGLKETVVQHKTRTHRFKSK